MVDLINNHRDDIQTLVIILLGIAVIILAFTLKLAVNRLDRKIESYNEHKCRNCGTNLFHSTSIGFYCIFCEPDKE